jgi:hypothetical protein
MLRVVHLPHLGFVVACSLFAARLAAAEPVIWRLDQTGRIGGHATEVLGAPRLVTERDGTAVYFNGASDGLFVPVNPLQGLAAFTIEVRFKPAADGPEAQRFLHVQDDIGAPGDPGARALLEIRLANGTWALDAFLSNPATKARLVLLDPAKRHPADRWTWVALVYERDRMTSYVDGVKELEGEVAFPPMGPGRVSLGVRQNKVYWFKGGISEVRFHPAAVAPGQLQHTTNQ